MNENDKWRSTGLSALRFPIVTDDYSPKPRRSPRNLKRRQIRAVADELAREQSKRNVATQPVKNSIFGEFGV